MHKEKKVTFLISSLAGGGAEGVCVNVANGLAEQGWDINLVVLHTKNSAYHDRVSEKVNFVCLNVNHARHAFFPLRNYIKQHKPERILVFNYELTVLMVLLRMVFGYKYKLIARNINTMSAKREQAKQANFWRKNIVTPLIDRFYFKADHVVNQCKAMEADLLSVYPQLQGKTSVIYNPVAKHVEDYANSHDLTQIKKENYFLCVGRLEKQKAFHFAIQAFAEVVKTHPEMRLKIVGKGSLEQELKQLAKELNVQNHVDFEGFQKDMIPYYTKARATLLTSLFEGFPNVLVESITLGTPVVAFDCPSGPSEIIEEGVNGYLVEYLNMPSLAAVMSSFIGEIFELDKVKSSGFNYCASKISHQYAILLGAGSD